jgi:CRISPR system Cascade subunit CasB
MNAPDTPTASPPSQEDTESSWPAKAVLKLARAINEQLSPGDVAALRRLSPHDVTAAAFWRLASEHLHLAQHPPRSEEQERAWAVILSGMAHMKGLHQPGRHPGHALRDADLSELRFTRLLRARDEVLFKALRDVAHYLAQKGERVDWTQLTELALYQEGERAERVRRRLARDFYTKPHSPTQE